MSTVVGTGVVRVAPDLTGFHAKIKAETAGIRDIKIGVDVDAGAAAAEIAGLRGLAGREGSASGKSFGGAFNREAQSEIKKAISALPAVNLDATPAHRRIAEIRAELAALSKKTIGVDVDAKEAGARLAVLRAELAAISRKHYDISVRVDTNEASVALAGVERLLAGVGGDNENVAKTAERAGFEIGGMASKAGLLLGVVVALGPPVAALAGGLVALVAPLSAGLIGGGLFGFLAGKEITQTDKVLQQIDQLHKKAEAAKTASKKADYLKQAEELEASLSKSQVAFGKALKGLKSSFGELTKGGVGDALLRPVTAGLQLLTKILKGDGLEALIKSASKALTGLVKGISAKGLDAFLGSLAKIAGPAISSIGRILTSTGSAFGSFVKAAAPLGQGILDHIADSMANLARYLKTPAGQEKLQAFFDWVKVNGPIVWQALKDLVKAFIDVGRAISPWAIGLARVIGFVSKAVSELANSGALRLFARVAVVSLGGMLFIVGQVATQFGNLAAVLSKVPGYGWLKPVAEGLRSVGAQARTASADLIGLGAAHAEPKVTVPEGAAKTGHEAEKAHGLLLALGQTGVGPVVTPPKGAPVTSSDAKGATSALGTLGKVNVSPKVNPTKLGPAIKESDDLAASHGRLKGKDVKVTMNSLSGPIGQAGDLASAIARLRDKDVTVTTHYRTTGTKPAASGRLVTGPQRILVGEAGPEAIVPLDRNLNAVDPSVRWLSAIAQGKSMRQSVAMPSGSKPSGGGDGVTVHQTINPQAGQSETEIGKAAANRLMFALQGAGR